MESSLNRKILLVPLIIALITTGNGCTQRLWEWTAPNQMRCEQDAPTATMSNGRKVLHFTYRSSVDKDLPVVLSIPLDADGKAIAPYAYTGQFHSIEEFWKSIPAAQRQAVLGKLPIRATTAPTDGTAIEVDIPNGNENQTVEPGVKNDNGNYTAQNGLVAVAYHTGRSMIFLIPTFYTGQPIDVPQGTQIVLIPALAAKDDPGRPVRVALAVAGTPLAVALDATLVAVVVVGVVILLPILIIAYAPMERTASTATEPATRP